MASSSKGLRNLRFVEDDTSSCSSNVKDLSWIPSSPLSLSSDHSGFHSNFSGFLKDLLIYGVSFPSHTFSSSLG